LITVVKSFSSGATWTPEDTRKGTPKTSAFFSKSGRLANAKGQYVLDDDGERVYGLWFIPAEECCDLPLIVDALLDITQHNGIVVQIASLVDHSG
jgi:hypothetical protein